MTTARRHAARIAHRYRTIDGLNYDHDPRMGYMVDHGKFPPEGVIPTSEGGRIEQTTDAEPSGRIEGSYRATPSESERFDYTAAREHVAAAPQDDPVALWNRDVDFHDRVTARIVNQSLRAGIPANTTGAEATIDGWLEADPSLAADSPVARLLFQSVREYRDAEAKAKERARAEYQNTEEGRIDALATELEGCGVEHDEAQALALQHVEATEANRTRSAIGSPLMDDHAQRIEMIRADGERRREAIRKRVELGFDTSDLLRSRL